VEISSEFALLARCCRWNFPGEDGAEVAPADGLDWQRFVRLARFHRVQGLAWRALAASGVPMPAEVSDALSGDAAAIAATNLEAAAECDRLRGRFADAGLRLLFLKGLTLGALAYGNASSKSAVDVDVLVEAAELERTAELLGELGYRLVVPGRSSGLRRWHAARKESLWRKSGPGLSVDLHTRLADNDRLIAVLGVDSPTQSVDIGNHISLSTLGDDELFAYLAVHGASSAWFRLKWISDFAAVASGREPARIDRLYRRSQALGAGRAAGQALLLADRLFGTLERLPQLGDELRSDRATVRLYRAALGQLAGHPEPVEPTSTPFGTLTIHWTQFLLAPGAQFKLSELGRQLRLMLR
jgi:hypothetical protein